LFDAKPDSRQLHNNTLKKSVFKNRQEIKQETEVKKDDPLNRELTSNSFNPEELQSNSKPDNSIFGRDSHKIPPKFESKINPRIKRVNEKNFIQPIQEEQTQLQQQQQQKQEQELQNKNANPNSVQKALNNFGSAFGPDKKKED